MVHLDLEGEFVNSPPHPKLRITCWEVSIHVNQLVWAIAQFADETVSRRLTSDIVKREKERALSVVECELILSQTEMYPTMSTSWLWNTAPCFCCTTNPAFLYASSRNTWNRQLSSNYTIYIMAAPILLLERVLSNNKQGDLWWKMQQSYLIFDIPFKH